MTDSIFDSRGRIITDLDEQVSPDRRPAYHALVAAQTACERAESDQRAADDVLAEKVRTHDQIHAALPRETFLDLARAAATAYARR